jgi:hypothetical protein
MNRILPSTVLCALLIVSSVLSAFHTPLQDEDRPVIIVSSGSVILTVAKGNWVREATGRFRQEFARGRDVRTFSATTGTGATACTVEGEALQVMYGANEISFGRVAPGRSGARRPAFVNFRANAVVRARDEQTLVIDTTDPLVSFTNGKTTCQIVAGRVEIRQLH